MSSRITVIKGTGPTLEQGAAVALTYTATADDATANAAAITLTGLPAIDVFMVQIYRSDVEVKADADITASGKVLTVADGQTTYAVTAGDVIMVYAAGTLTE